MHETAMGGNQTSSTQYTPSEQVTKQHLQSFLPLVGKGERRQVLPQRRSSANPRAAATGTRHGNDPVKERIPS